MEHDADYPWAVDIPIPPAGLGPLLPVILDAAQACQAGAIVSVYAVPEVAEVRQWFNRIATKTPTDAQRLTRTFRSLGARQVR